MEAMILAAGRGSRLRPLTDTTPKALIDIAGLPVLERVARRLIVAGADRLVINLHHLGDQIREHVEGRDGFGVPVRFSEEQGGALETGGAVLHAFRQGMLAADGPFFLHNSDILTELPLAEMYQRHCASSSLATLGVMERESRRQLLFDDEGLFGRVDEGRGIRIEARPAVGEVRRLAFAGVHVIAERFPRLLEERGAFSILDPYLRLAAAGERIQPFRVDPYGWIDMGSPEQLAVARERYGP